MKQRLLYLYAQTPDILSPVLALTNYEPVPGFSVELTPEVQEWPYQSVHEAVCDGWRVVNFPNQQAIIEDDEIDLIGYQFILEKFTDEA
jgi:hypothetical protein